MCIDVWADWEGRQKLGYGFIAIGGMLVAIGI